MEWWQATILAIVEGITEFLPISSTAHLVLTSQLLGVSQSEFNKTFEIAIQLGAIMAIVGLYFKKIWGNWKVMEKVAIAFLPTGLIGMGLYKFVKGYLLGNSEVAIAALAIGGIIIIWWEQKLNLAGKQRIEDLDWKRCVGIGVMQTLSLIPGVSRAAATIFGGMGMGLTRGEAVEMSFLLAVPTMAAATGWDLFKSWKSIDQAGAGILIWGGIVAGITAAVVVKWLVEYVRKKRMGGFGWYRIALAIGWMVIDRGLL